MTIKHITTYLENIAPLAYQESYDNAGLIVGDPQTICTKALLCLDSLESVVDEAIELGCNLIIAHHPIIFKGLKKITGRNYIEKTIIKAIKNDIAIYVAHTNLDNVHVGVNRKICDRLGLKNCRILRQKRQILKRLSTLCPLSHSDTVRNALLQAGATKVGDYIQTSFNMLGVSTFRQEAASIGQSMIGVQQGEMQIEVLLPIHLERRVLAALRKSHPNSNALYNITTLDNAYQRIGSGMIGEVETSISESNFLKHLKTQMQVSCIRYTQLLGKEVKKVAVCGGAGDFLLNDAIAQGADIFVTADLKYHRFFDANNQIVIADIGHFESEQFTVQLFQELLNKKFSNFEAIISTINTNPVKYL